VPMTTPSSEICAPEGTEVIKAGLDTTGAAEQTVIIFLAPIRSSMGK